MRNICFNGFDLGRKNISTTHNRPQIFRRLRKEEFDMIKEKEIFTYLSTLEVEYNVVFETKVQNELVSCCRDRRNGGLGNFIEIIELLFSIIRPEWIDISYQIIKRDHRILHNHFEQFQSYTSLKPNKNYKDDKEQIFLDNQEETRPYIDVKKFDTKPITFSLLKDALRHKMTM